LRLKIPAYSKFGLDVTSAGGKCHLVVRDSIRNPLVEPAPAKINLTLTVHGRRPDGYHDIESLVVFAGGEASDLVTLEPGGSFRLEVSGAEAALLAKDGDQANLVARAVAAALREAPHLRTGTFRLEKRLPIAAGIGGGSADAAAALRLLQGTNANSKHEVDWLRIAASIGADVPVCLSSRASMMRGLGERVTAVSGLPRLWAVLANPRIPMATGDVFKALDARALHADAMPPPETAPPDVADIAGCLAYLAEHGNDLEDVVCALCPEVADLRARLAELDEALLARMSGSGATCFALFASRQAAERGAQRLAALRPGLWIVATPLG
jgi:4-diphosphocytidyl-2-C-methyl-D-erythritol kinase